ncbi:purine-nucleoside phosphorylase [Ferruginibacter sp. HRS2-29]|uniref:purine-nucleoside phosphorylase n=1 Tax=Ferruginibacter sp. HRS2-29 TaxID=2487334 RepID=UPI0034E952C8|nr:purine-nucleoside phosphorylase [Ferruginibacter sp. HRS2-29]
MMKKIEEAVSYIKGLIGAEPQVGIVLGSGLGSFTKEINIEKEIPYADIPHFPVSTVKGHSGKLIYGELSGKKVLAMAGRFHYYEGYTPQEVVFPVRVMKFLGVKTLLLSNAAGATNRTFKVGDLMIINDHISFLTPNPLIGKNQEELGTRFPDMTEPYKKDLIKKADAIAAAAGYDIKHGVYISVTGPTFETKAEYRMVLALGADVVGMSTVQEVIAGVHMGLDVFAVSVVTDLGIREEENVITHEEVLEAAKEAEPKLTHIFKELVAQL